MNIHKEIEVKHCEFTCDSCRKKAPRVYARNKRGIWFKPELWFQRSGDDGAQLACSRECIDVVAQKSDKTNIVLPNSTSRLIGHMRGNLK